MPGIERRSQIDTETFKGLLAINGGGAVALLSFVAAILNKPNAAGLVHAALFSVLLMIFGIGAALVHNHLRRRCSLIYEAYNGSPPRGTVFGRLLPSPTICFFSWACMWVSLGAFLLAGAVVAIVGMLMV